MFLKWCKNAGVPTDGKYNKKTERYNHGFFTVGGAYGMMRIEWVMKCGGSRDVSGFMGAREMFTWLQNFDPKTQAKYLRKRDEADCKGIEAHRKFLRERGPVDVIGRPWKGA